MKKKRSFLLVEDNVMDVQLTQEAFAEVASSVALQIVRNGRDALDYLFGRDKYANRLDYPLPELILLDLKMADIDGLEVLQQLKSTPLLKCIPVVILTSSRERKDLLASYGGGANSYLHKPVSYDDFVELIKGIDAYWGRLNVPIYELEENDDQ